MVRGGGGGSRRGGGCGCGCLLLLLGLALHLLVRHGAADSPDSDDAVLSSRGDELAVVADCDGPDRAGVLDDGLHAVQLGQHVHLAVLRLHLHSALRLPAAPPASCSAG